MPSKSESCGAHYSTANNTKGDWCDFVVIQRVRISLLDMNGLNSWKPATTTILDHSPEDSSDDIDECDLKSCELFPVVVVVVASSARINKAGTL